jgi:hypothetical protein
MIYCLAKRELVEMFFDNIGGSAIDGYCVEKQQKNE